MASSLIELRSALMTELESVANSIWHFRVNCILSAISDLFLKSNKEDNINPCLRFMEVMTTTRENEDIGKMQDRFAFLLSGDYLASLRALCDSRIPPILTETTRPPTPLAEMILQLILKPIRIQSQADKKFKQLLMRKLCDSFFSKPFSEQVRLFILPSISSGLCFPIADFTANVKLEELQPSPWLLYSFLKLGIPDKDAFSPLQFHQYWAILSHLSSYLAQSGSKFQDELDDSDDDSDDEMIVDEEETSEFTEEHCLRACKDLLNHPTFVSNLIDNCEKLEDAEILRFLCILCHQLLLSDRNAMLNNRFLNILAFTPHLVIRIWRLVLDTKQKAIIGKPMPLITVILGFV